MYGDYLEAAVVSNHPFIHQWIDSVVYMVYITSSVIVNSPWLYGTVERKIQQQRRCSAFEWQAGQLGFKYFHRQSLTVRFFTCQTPIACENRSTSFSRRNTPFWIFIPSRCKQLKTFFRKQKSKTTKPSWKSIGDERTL